MPKTMFAVSTFTLAVLLAAIPFDEAGAQVRRSGGAEGGPPPGAPRGIPRNARLPFAGVWDGTFTLAGPRGGEQKIPVVMVFDAADTVKALYAGATILPNGARAPHLETAVAHGEISWKQSNSGGGFWVYRGRMVTSDSIAGTVALQDWPQLPAGEKAPTGTIALVRRGAGK